MELDILFKQHDEFRLKMEMMLNGIINPIRNIDYKLSQLIEKVNQMAATQQDLDAAISSLQSTVTQLESTTATIISTLTQLQTANGIDLSNEIAQLTTINNALSTLNTNETSALPTTTATDATGVAPNAVSHTVPTV